MKLRDMIGVVTGAAGGTGPAVVNALKERCEAVVGVIRGEEVTWREVGSSHFEATADVLNEAQVASLVSEIRGRLGTFHAWINLVGGYTHSGVVEDSDSGDWSRMFELNFRSVLNCCRMILPVFKSQGFGRIVNFGSVPGLEGMAGSGPYAVGKAAVINITSTVALEGEDHNITANALVPTVIDTPANRKAMTGVDPEASGWITPERIAQEILSLIPSSRTGEVVRL